MDKTNRASIGSSQSQLVTHDCSDIQKMSHIVDSCPMTKHDGSLQRLHTVDEAAVDWLTAYGT